MGSRSSDSVAKQPLDQNPKNYRKYFKKGKVFRALWPEPANSTEQHRNDAVNVTRWGEQIILKIHWFVVVQTWSGHCLVVPVHTYDGRGTTKSGLNADDHCALVAKGQSEVTLDGERLRRPPLHIILENSDIELKPSSRINFAKFHTVEYNIKISTVGRIAPEDVSTMGMYWHQSITKARVDAVPCNQDEWKVLEYQDAERQRQKLGEWLLMSSEYKRWLKPSGEILFCAGIPGAGKTTLTTRVVSDLQNRFSKYTNVGVCFFYCNSGFQRNSNFQGLFGSLVEQLLQRRRTSSNYPSDMENRSEKDQPEMKDNVDRFRAITTHLSQTFVVIDALDELELCREGDQELVKKLLGVQADLHFNLFATSRFIPYVTRLFSNAMTKEIHAEHDISIYLDSQLSRFPEYVKTSPKLQRRIKFHIEQAADGIFLLATRLIENWIEKSSVDDIETALLSQETSFSVLHATWYEPIKRIVEPGEWESLAGSALMWITCAKWPLTASELQHAMAIQLHGDGRSSLIPENIPNLEDILSACAGFVSIENGTGIVNLVHASAKEFLVQSQWFPDANEIIAETCAKYLFLEHFAQGHVQSDGELHGRLQSFPLYAYASWNWGYHAQLSPKAPELQRVVQHFAERPAHVQAWHQAIFGYSSDSTRAVEVRKVHWNVNLFQIAAFLNLETLITLLFEEYQTDIEAKDEKSRTALSYAAEGGSKRTVKKLISYGAKIQAEDKNGTTPLSWAFRYHQDAVVRFLLKRIAGLEESETVDKKVDKQEELILASQLGLPRSVEWLLAKVKAPDAIDEAHPRTPLMWAVMHGHNAVVRALLLDDDVSCETKDPFGQTAILLASRMGAESTLRLLIEFEANRDAEDKNGHRPLWWAAKHGHDGIVKLLIEEGVLDIEAKDNLEHRSALSLAAEGGYIGIVQLLLKQKADPESSNIAGQTPLFFAAAAGHVDVVKLLLEQGVDPCPRDVFDKTPQDRAILRHDTLIETHLKNAEESTYRVSDDGVGSRSGGFSRLLDSGPDTAYPQFCWELDGQAKKAYPVFELLERHISPIPWGALGQISLRQLRLRAGGVKQKIVRFMFDYDDNEYLHGFQTVSYSSNKHSSHHNTSNSASGSRTTVFNSEVMDTHKSRDLRTSMVVTKASVDETDIFGLKPKTSSNSHSATQNTEMNLFQRVNDLLLDAAQADPVGHPRRIRLLSDIGMIHVFKYQETESLDNLKEAIAKMRQALKELGQTKSKLQPRNATNAAQCSDIQVVLYANLSIQLEHLYRVTAHFATLEEAIRHIRLAISATTSQIERCRLIHVLGIQLRDRYAKMGDIADLEEAIRLTEEAVASPLPGDDWTLSRIAMLNNLASLMSDRFAQTGNINDSNEAHTIMTKAIELIPPRGIKNNAHAALLHNLGSLHADVFSKTREKYALEEAIRYAKNALKIAPKTSTERAVVESHHAMLLCIQHEWFAGEYDHKKVIDTVKAVVDEAQAAIPAAVLYNLGSLHLYGFSEHKGSHDFIEAVSIINKAIDATLEVHTDLRMIFNHSRVRFGNKHPTMGVLDSGAAVRIKPSWYLQVSGPEELGNTIIKNSGSGIAGSQATSKNGSQAHNIEEFVRAAAGLVKNSENSLERLLASCGPNAITNKVVEAAAGNTENGDKVLEILFRACGEDKPITEQVLETAARNLTRGDKVMDCIFRHRSQKIVPTDAVIRAAVKNEVTGGRILLIILDQCIRGCKRKRRIIN